MESDYPVAMKLLFKIGHSPATALVSIEPILPCSALYSHALKPTSNDEPAASKARSKSASFYNMNLISIHVLHDSNIALQLRDFYHVIELERIFSERYFDLSTSTSRVTHVIDFIRSHYTSSPFEVGIMVEGSKEVNPGIAIFNTLASTWRTKPHHMSHAAAAFYQSPFAESLIISFDGGGPDGYFRVFKGSYKEELRYFGDPIPLNLGSAYAVIAEPIREIKRSGNSFFSNAGKLMGLAAYGKPRREWMAPIRDFFSATTERSALRLKRLPTLGRELDLDFTQPRSISGQIAFDYAATIQLVFETLFLEQALPLIESTTLPVCLSGGCALNVTLNERLARIINRPLFVPPNPNDCGLALGGLFLANPPKRPVTITYAGVPLLDRSHLAKSVTEHNARFVDLTEVAKLLAEGKIIGVAQGNSEHGPRALGNRSILCDPTAEGLKDRLNNKIKFREAFRPFAPVVRKEDAHRYFDCLDYDMSYMSFNPLVKKKWRRKLSAIVHVDNTARVQTVTATQNRWLYDLLTEFAKIQGYGVLLNTSFNIKGKPILTTISAALENLFTTDLDYALIEGYLFENRCLKTH